MTCKFFLCVQVADGRAEAVDVYMYYWDSRDGPSFEGWWFGNKLGGTQVWSHNASGSLTPPPSGWKIPWDGSVRATLSVTNKAEQQKNEAQMKLKNMTTDVNSVSTAAKGALDQAKAAAADYTSSEGWFLRGLLKNTPLAALLSGLKDAETLLQPQLSSLAEAMKQLTDAQRAGSNQETLRQVQQMRSGLQALMSAINVELGKVRSSKQKAEQSEKQKALEERDMTVFQEILPEAVSKANAAEDAVEKAVITSEMIAAGGDDLDEVRQAVGATEQAVQEAQKAMGEARIFLNAKQAAARRYESEKVKAKAIQELGQLQQQLQEAQQKLVPLKNVRQEFVQRTAAQKMMQEVLEKLSPAEVDVDRAEEATQMLTSEEGASKELMVQAQQAVAKAGEHVNTVVRFIESKKKNAVGLAKEELQKMEDRARQSVQRLVDLKTSQKEATEKVGLEVLVKEAAEKLQTVQETVAKAADAEGPFLMGVEELPLDETLAAVKVPFLLLVVVEKGQGMVPLWSLSLSAAAPQGEVKQSSPGERSFRRGCCSMAFLVAYYFWTVKYYAALKETSHASERSIEILEDSPLCICRHVTLPNCMLSFYCEHARHAHTLEKTGMLVYWKGALASLCCFPCTLLYFHNSIRRAMGAGRMDPLANCVYSFCCPWCVLAQHAEALDVSTNQQLKAFLVVGRSRSTFGTDEEVEELLRRPGTQSMYSEPTEAVETASTAANTAASIARMFIATKLVEAKRFTPELSKEAQTKLKAFQSDLETHTKRLNELKKSTAERKKAVTMREAEHEVKKAEELGKAVAEAAKSLMDDEKLTQLSYEPNAILRSVACHGYAISIFAFEGESGQSGPSSAGTFRTIPTSWEESGLLRTEGVMRLDASMEQGALRTEGAMGMETPEGDGWVHAATASDGLERDLEKALFEKIQEENQSLKLELEGVRMMMKVSSSGWSEVSGDGCQSPQPPPPPPERKEEKNRHTPNK
eukprot:symbB.v1.2.037923.t1/scaffold5738.1/size24079/3